MGSGFGGFTFGVSPFGSNNFTSLNDYLQQVQRFLRDERQIKYNIFNLRTYVNQARRHIASEGQCVRILPSVGQILSLSLNDGGSGYSTTDPPVVISGPTLNGGLNATAVATAAAGAVTSIMITNPGAGYLTNPTVTVTGGSAVIAATIAPAITTTPNLEVYPFVTLNQAIQLVNPGIFSVLGVQTIATSWGAWKPTMDKLDWSSFQAYRRSWNIGSTNYPVCWSQYGQGLNGSVYMWPIPSQQSLMDWDCYCIPTDLLIDTDFEAIPYPWTDAVPYYATYLALLGESRGEARDDSRFFLSEYGRLMREARSFSTPASVPSFYDGDY